MSRKLPVNEELVVELARGNKTVYAIAKLMATDKKRIRNILRKHGVFSIQGPPEPAAKKKRVRHCTGSYLPDRPFVDRINPMEAAKEALIDAYVMMRKPPILKITDTGMFLNGHPAGINRVMQETNRHRIFWGMDQIDANPDWKISVE